jgi:hypothetical protein
MSNSPTNSPMKQIPSPGQTPPEPLNPQERQELISLRREKAALSAMLWNLVRQAYPDSHSAEVMPAADDPLWQIAFVQSSVRDSGKVRILAGTILPITESEKKRVVRLLRGTATPMHTALAQLELERFPPSYVEKQIEAHLKWQVGDEKAKTPLGVSGYWHSVTAPLFGEKAKNFLRLPKS